LFDTYGGAALGLSLELLDTTYSGNCVKVRRDNGDEQDFGFTSGVLDSTSLLTFCGSGDGFVVTWYDQSGNAKNVSSATENQQPQIVSSGAMLVDNGKPYLLYDGNGTTGLFNTSSGLSNTNSSIFATYNSNDSNSGCILSGSGGSGFIGVMTSGSSGAPNNAAGTPKYYKKRVFNN